MHGKEIRHFPAVQVFQPQQPVERLRPLLYQLPLISAPTTIYYWYLWDLDAGLSFPEKFPLSSFFRVSVYGFLAAWHVPVHPWFRDMYICYHGKPEGRGQTSADMLIVSFHGSVAWGDMEFCPVGITVCCRDDGNVCNGETVWWKKAAGDRAACLYASLPVWCF